jgi:hypothetical protein
MGIHSALKKLREKYVLAKINSNKLSSYFNMNREEANREHW